MPSSSPLDDTNIPTHKTTQGREKEIIIFTTVRSNTRSVGFVADERRINVGLTRARCSLIVLANCKALKRDQVWGKLLSHARDIGCMYETRNPLRSFLKSVLQGDIKPEPARGDIAEVWLLVSTCLWGVEGRPPSFPSSGYGAGR